jgi:hypothetical protein
MSLHANISQQAYNKTRDDDVQGYDYIQQLSNRDSVVYINSITHHVIIGFKGTNSASDIVPDLAILSGTGASCFKDITFYREIPFVKQVALITYHPPGLECSSCIIYS